MVLLGACVFDLTFLLGARAEFDESRVRSNAIKGVQDSTSTNLFKILKGKRRLGFLFWDIGGVAVAINHYLSLVCGQKTPGASVTIPNRSDV